MPSRNTATREEEVAAEERRLLAVRRSLMAEMTNNGYQENAENTKRTIALFVREKLFKKCKFPTLKMFAKEEKIAKKVRKELEIKDEKAFEEEWDAWMMKLVRTTLQDKRGACGQGIQKEVSGKWEAVI